MVTQDGPLTVRQVCRAYLVGHVERNRKSKGAAEAKRMFDTMLGEFGDRIAEQVTRGQAFALLESYAHIPVQARRLGEIRGWVLNPVYEGRSDGAEGVSVDGVDAPALRYDETGNGAASPDRYALGAA